MCSNFFFVEHFIHLFIAQGYILRFCLMFLVVKLHKTYSNMSRGLGQVFVFYKMTFQTLPTLVSLEAIPSI